MAEINKFVVFFSLCAVFTLTALIASLPLNLPSKQYFQSYQYLNTLYPNLSNGDTAWMIVATILGFIISPLIAYFYSVLHGKDVYAAVKMAFYNSAIVTFLWVLFTFSLCYGTDARGNRILGYPQSYYMFHNVGAAPSDTLAPTIPFSIFAMFELSFAILTPTLIGLSLLERINLNGWIFFVFFWHIAVYCPIAHIVWHPEGFFPQNDIEDFSGGIVVNMLAGITAMVIHFIMGPVKDLKKPVVTLSSTYLTTFLLLFVSWFGINAGKAHGANSIAAQSVVNTIAGTTTAILTWIFVDMFFSRETSLVSVSNAVLIALVALTPCSGYVTVGGAMCVCIFTILFTYSFGYYITNELQSNQTPLSVITLHGFAGTVGFFFTAIFSYKFINEADFNGLTYGRGITLAHHISAILVLYPSIAIASGLVYYLVNFMFPITATTAASPSTEEPAAVEQAPVGAEDTPADVKSVELVPSNNGLDTV